SRYCGGTGPAAATGDGQADRRPTSDASARGAGAAAGRRSAAQTGRGGAETLWADCHLLLADRRAGHPRISFLRCAVRAGPAVLRGSREGRLREDPRPPRGRRLRVSIGWDGTGAGVSPRTPTKGRRPLEPLIWLALLREPTNGQISKGSALALVLPQTIESFDS